MLSAKDFIARYQNYSDEELYTIHANADSYSQEAGEALQVVIEAKGGLNALLKRLEAKAVIENEKQRIANEAAELALGGVDESFIKSNTSSAILSKEEIEDIIETHAAKGASLAEDKKITSDTVFKTLVGAALASLAGGAFASIQTVYFGATSLVMIIGIALICYGVVKLVSKKSYNNTAVLLASFVSFIISFLLGYLSLYLFGYLG